MAITVKAYLESPEGNKPQVRRFPVSEAEAGNYAVLREKLENVVDKSFEDGFHILWKDDEGDDITVSSNEELKEALTTVEQETLKLYIRKQQKQGSQYSGQEKSSTCHPHHSSVNLNGLNEAFHALQSVFGIPAEQSEGQDGGANHSGDPQNVWNNFHGLNDIITTLQDAFRVPPTYADRQEQGATSADHPQHPSNNLPGLTDIFSALQSALGSPSAFAEEKTQEGRGDEGGEPSTSQPPNLKDLTDVFKRIWTELGRDAVNCGIHNGGAATSNAGETSNGRSTQTEGTHFNSVKQIIEDILARKAEAQRSQITEAATLMMSMGFSNEKEWLTKLLELTQGNVNQVLDIVSNLKQYTGGDVDCIPQIVISLFEAHATNPQQVLNVLQSMKINGV